MKNSDRFCCSYRQGCTILSLFIYLSTNHDHDFGFSQLKELDHLCFKYMLDSLEIKLHIKSNSRCCAHILQQQFRIRREQTVKISRRWRASPLKWCCPFLSVLLSSVLYQCLYSTKSYANSATKKNNTNLFNHLTKTTQTAEGWEHKDESCR